MNLKIYKTKKEVADNFSKYLADFIGDRNEVHIALSGGSTPKIVFDELAARYADIIDWKKVHFYWGDERCVPPTDEDSNYKMTVQHLLSKIKIPAGNIHRIKGENEPEYEAERYTKLLEEQIPGHDRTPQFDLIILGMGDDGHTASIFPHELQLWNSKKLCEVAVHPGTGQQRITITGKVINNAHEVAFLVTGKSKAERVKEIVNKKGDFEKYPAHLVAPKSGNLAWFLDVAAASQITLA